MKRILEIEENSNSPTIDLLEEAIRARAREVIESLYEDEVQRFLNKTSSIVDKTENKLVVRNGFHKERTILITNGYVTVRLPRVDDRALEEKDRFVSKVLPPFARKTPTVEAILSAAYLAGISSNKFSAMLYDVLGEEAKGLI